MLNFTQQLEAPLSQKQKTFSGLFLAFLKCALNLEHFQKKDEYHSLVISRVNDSERGGYLNVYKVLLQNTIRWSMCYRVPNTAEMSSAPLLTYFVMNSK